MSELLTAVMRTGVRLPFRQRLVKRGYEESRQGDGSLCSLAEREQLERYAEAFYGLAGLFQKMPCQKERLGDAQIEELFVQVRSYTCAGCGREKLCWEKDPSGTCRLLYEILSELEYEGSISAEMTEHLAKRCARPDAVRQTLLQAFGQARLDLMWNNRMMEQRMAAGEQIFQTAELLRRSAAGFQDMPEYERRIRQKMKKELRFLGIETGAVRVFRGEAQRPEIYLLLRGLKQSCVSAKTIGEILSESCGQKMRPAWNCQAAVTAEPANFHFVPDTKYQIFCGTASITRAGEMVSGDNFAFLQKDTGKVVMSLADGMGSGVGACRESEKVIELLEQFLDAGFPQETAVRMINSCMLLQNYQQMFSTIDLCMVDLYNAKCDIIKSGAAPTFLCRGNETEVISSNAFPAGVMQQSDYESLHRQLASGDSIVMMTDGVLEALPQEGREKMIVELIGKSASKNAKEHARRLMEKVYLMQKLQARDDMTILVGKLWAK